LDQYVILEIDGPGVSPETLDAAALLEFAAAFFQLVQVNASENGGLTLTDVRIIDKCAAVLARPDRLELAKDSAEEAVRQIAGFGDIPKGGTAYVERARASVRLMPKEQRAKVLVGAWHRDVVAQTDMPPEPLDAILSVRATPIRIGGSRPAVRFRSDLEADFTLSTTQEIARRIGAYLYREVDIEGVVHRAADGTIADGRLNSFEPVSTSDPRPAWREWFRSVGGDELADEDRTGVEQ
jgi:hypothetical protein